MVKEKCPTFGGTFSILSSLKNFNLQKLSIHPLQLQNQLHQQYC